MKITFSRLQHFFSNLFSYNQCLIYGDNIGKVDDIVKQIIQKANFTINDPFSTTKLSFKNVNNDIKSLINKVNLLSFTGTKRLIIITDVDGKLSSDLQKLFNENHAAYILLISYKILPTNSTTRTYCENSEKCAVIACYPDEEHDVKGIIINYLQKSEVTFTEEVVNILAYYLVGDRANIYSELNKLVIYANETKKITEKDVKESLFNQNLFNIENMVFACANKNIDKALLLIMSEKNLIPVIRAISTYFMRLYQVATILNNGETEANALKKLNPPLFFKHFAKFKNHLKLWNIEQILAVLQQLIKLEIICKTTNNLESRLLIKKWLLSLNKLH